MESDRRSTAVATGRPGPHPGGVWGADLPWRTSGPVALGSAPRSPDTPLRVYVTVDTECSMGGLFLRHDPAYTPVGPRERMLGRVGNREYGVRRMMEMLEAVGLPGTFFLEPFCSYYFGETPIGAVAREIRSRGHDVELHPHPGQRVFRGGADLAALAREEENRCAGEMWGYGPEEQVDLIREGADLVERWTGERPVAFRAPGFAADRCTLCAVGQAGLAIDCSLVHPDFICRCRAGDRWEPNSPRVVGRVVSLPMTTFLHRCLPGHTALRSLEISSVSVEQIRFVLDALDNAGTTDAVLLLHSFSMVKARDLRYRSVRPDHLVMNRFRRTLELLASAPERWEVTTLRELADRMRRERVEIGGPGFLPYPGLLPSLKRDLIQVVNRW